MGTINEQGARVAFVGRRRIVVIGVVAAIILAIGAVVYTGHDTQHLDVAASSGEPRTTTQSSSTASSTSDTASTNSSTTPSTATVLSTTTATDNAPGDTTPGVPQHTVSAVVVSTPAVAGQILTVSVTIRNRKVDDQVGLLFEGQHVGFYDPPPGFQPITCADSGLRSEEETFRFNVDFKIPGHHYPAVYVYGCGPSPDPTIDLPVDINVEGPPGPTNGAFLPAVRSLEWSTGPQDGTADPSQTHILFNGIDRDGVVERFVIDWGDGTAPNEIAISTTDEMRARACDPAQEYDATEGAGLAGHHFANDAPRSVTVTIVSGGCDGADPHQSASATLTN